MNDTHARRSAKGDRMGLFDDPGRIAPHLNKSWRDDFIVELRLLDVAGDKIGDALVTADTHVQESGETAEEAFCDPKTYARETAAALGTSTQGWRVTPRDVVGNVAGLIGMLGATIAFGAWLDGAAVIITLGTVVALLVLLALVTALLSRPVTILRLAVEHRVAFAIVAPFVLTGGFVAIFFLLRQPLFDLGAPVVGAVSTALLLLSSGLAWVGSAGDQDEITAPGQAPSSGTRSRAAISLILPLFTVLLLALTWVLSRLG